MEKNFAKDRKALLYSGGGLPSLRGSTQPTEGGHAMKHPITVPKLARFIRRKAPHFTRDQAEEIAWGILRRHLSK